MNKLIFRNQKFAVLLTVVLFVAAMMAGCGQKADQEPQTVESAPATEASVMTTTPEEMTLPEEMEIIETFPEVEAPEAGSITYAEYLDLTVEEQQAYYENFETPDAFFAWLNPAMAEYAASTEHEETYGNNQEETGPIEVADGIFVEEELEDW